MSKPVQQSKSDKSNNIDDKAKSSTDYKNEAIIIRKYANRRLYNTQNSKYINLEDLREMVCNNVNFVVIDNATNNDLTRAVLSQIILDSEIKGDHIFPMTFLKKIIQVYDNKAEKYIFPNFLEETMSYYKKNQTDIMSTINQNIANLTQITDFSKLQEINQKNYEMLLNSFGMLLKDKGLTSKKASFGKDELSKDESGSHDMKTVSKKQKAKLPSDEDVKGVTSTDMDLRINLLEQQFQNFQNLISSFVSTKEQNKD